MWVVPDRLEENRDGPRAVGASVTAATSQGQSFVRHDNICEGILGSHMSLSLVPIHRHQLKEVGGWWAVGEGAEGVLAEPGTSSLQPVCRMFCEVKGKPPGVAADSNNSSYLVRLMWTLPGGLNPGHRKSTLMGHSLLLLFIRLPRLLFILFYCLPFFFHLL